MVFKSKNLLDVSAMQIVAETYCLGLKGNWQNAPLCHVLNTVLNKLPLYYQCDKLSVPPKPQIKQNLQVGLKPDYFENFWSSVENASPCFKRSSR